MMGKSHKISRGYASGFMPDYCHVVGTMEESEGFGSSGRVETEMTASDDSCEPKKKCISLNAADGYNRFGVPTQVLSLSKMSSSERKDLEIKLRNDLEQVRILQKKFVSFSSNFGVLLPVSDIHSCSDGQRRPGAEISQSFMKAPSGKKKSAPGRNGPRKKGPGARRPEPVKQAVSSNSNTAMLMKQCETLLNRMTSHQYGWVFNAPVDVVKLKIPDYFTVIKHPMDLGTIKSKLMSGQYSSPLEFAADVRLTFKNAMTYNPPGNDVHIMAQTLGKFFEVRWKPIEKKIPVTEEPLLSKSSIILESETEATLAVPPCKKKKNAPFESKARPELVKQDMSNVEKLKLSTELETLLDELPEKIIDFLKESSLNGSQVSEDEIEIDIDALNDDTLCKLRQLLDDYLLEKQKSQAKAEPCEMELHNESGFSNSSMQPCKDNDPADEEVDIGGNYPPVSSFTPVEIETDHANRNNKCSSSSSSRSDCGSSSSDRDPGNSSGRESDGDKGSIPMTIPKVTVSYGVRLEQKELDQRDSRDFLDDFTERKSQQMSILDEPNDHHEGGSAPPERQVSPEKLYRAALLRSRFADTIIKAQEKTLEKGEVWDPEKLKLEKEELERRRREEKTRLQAEAKAAEEARRKAEAAAAAEAKKKRELEREAARQALLKMEKTVDINENSLFMEDLELFRAAPDERLERFIEETSPGHSRNGPGSFKFNASSNPLEQLGLYMKGDDEDEEENESHSIPDLSICPEEDTSKDPEDREID